MPEPTLTYQPHLDLWSFRGAVPRRAYAAYGIVLCAIKFCIDFAIATLIFQRPWSIADYIQPSRVVSMLGIDMETRLFFLTLLLASLPFVWVGLALTVRRLRDAGLPLILSVLLFVPLLKFALFAIGIIVPGKSSSLNLHGPRETGDGREWGWWLPRDPWPSAAMAVGLTSLLGLSMTALSTVMLESYGWALFVGLPFVLGAVAAKVYGYHHPRSVKQCLGVAVLACGVVAGLLIVFAIEGVICLIMAIPIWVPCVMVGALLGCALQRNRLNNANKSAATMVMALSLPLLMGLDAKTLREPTTRRVDTHTIIAAPPSAVWEHVVAFTPLPKPQGWLFRAGVAYPIQARIEGHGVGAIRYCEFSTGAFVEPITRWEQPTLLAFDVTESPPPMSELSLYAHVHPPHLDGFLQSQKGQFRLRELPNGHTELIGTTWYRHAMWPELYWHQWSDAIIHRIHHQVLDHIKNLSESDPYSPSKATEALP